MSSIFGALRSSADALAAFERGLTTSQNNVANVSTPGYARQTQGLTARPFDSSVTTGGVRVGELLSSRNEYIESSVRRRIQDYNRWSQHATSLEPVENTLDIAAGGGISSALDELYVSFSAWSTTPNDATARRAVIEKAKALAESFQVADRNLAATSSDTDTQMKGLVGQINTLAKQLSEFNSRRTGNQMDPGVDANFHATLEQLSEIADVQAYQQSDGSWTVLLGDETPLVVGKFQYDISFETAVPTDPAPAYPEGAPNAIIRDSAGREITSQISSGQLGGLLDVRNRVLAGLRGDSSQPGELNRLAKAIADQVNQLLTGGRISDGPPEVAGIALFTYGASDTGTARTLSVNSAITPSQLAAIAPGPPYVSNGTALALAGLSSTSSIDGYTFSAFYARLASLVGAEISGAEDNRSLEADSLAQARDLRQQVSGVSLDEEAIKVLEFQKAYQAAAKMISVLSDLTDIVISMVR